MFNKFKYLILIVVIIGVLLPEPASAILGTGLFDVFDAMLQGISEKTGPMAALLILLLSLYLLGLGLLHASIATLETFIFRQPLWLAQLQPMTMAGWSFVVGLANMLLIIIFIAIAFAFILKIETFQAKKALPKLIIIALLLNFSLLFVNIMVDISQIAFNTVLAAIPDGLFSLVRDALMGPLWATIVPMVILITGSIVCWSIPIASAFCQVLFAALFIPLILPHILIISTQLLLMGLLIPVLFVLAFLFAARVFIIQILAVLAPLAFIFLILPQTQKFWSFWFKTLTEWLILGISTLFLLVLGFSMLGLLSPFPQTTEPGDIPGVLAFIFAPIRALPSFIVYYFAVFVYLVVIIYIHKKFLPEVAQNLIDTGKGIATTFMDRIAMPFGGAMLGQAHKQAAYQEQREAQAEKEGRSLTRLEKFGSLVSQPMRGWYRLQGTTVKEEEQKRMAEKEKEGKETKDVELLLREIRDALRAKNDRDAVGFVSAGIEKGGIFKKRILEEISAEEAVRLGLAANAMGMTNQAERIAQAFLGQTEKMGFEPLDDEDKARGYNTIKEKLIAEAKGDEVKDFAKNFWQSPEEMEAILKFWDGSQLAMAADTFGKRFIEDLMTVANKLTPEQFAKINPRALLYLSGNAAQDLGYSSVGGLERKEVRDKIREKPSREEREEKITILREKIREVFPGETETPSPEKKEGPSHRPGTLGERGPHSAPRI